MCDKMANSAYILKVAENDPFLRLQMRAKEMFVTQNRNSPFLARFREQVYKHFIYFEKMV